MSEELEEAAYKNTEIGVIPKDWSDETLGEILKIKHGKSQKEVESPSGPYPIYGTGGLMGYATNYLYDKESVLIGRKGTIDKPRYLDTPFWTVDTLFYSEVKEGVVAKLIYYNFLMIDWYSHNEASGVPSLNASKIEKIKIPLPPSLKEQQTIATALSDVDTLIINLDKLIAKKKTIKQGAMQRLLKSPAQGGKRLPGFEGEWKTVRLGSLCSIFGRIGFRGYTVDDIVNEGYGAISISPSNLQNGKLVTEKSTYISWFKYEESPEIKIKNGDILLVKTGSTFGKTALVQNLKVKATINPQLVVLKNFKVPSAFLAYLMAFPIIQNQINSTIVGGAIPTLSQAQVANFSITIPPRIQEQEAIATILSDMDKEIESLETKKSKYLRIKQGMMQELLTGKTRLV